MSDHYRPWRDGKPKRKTPKKTCRRGVDRVTRHNRRSEDLEPEYPAAKDALEKESFSG